MTHVQMKLMNYFHYQLQYTVKCTKEELHRGLILINIDS